MKKIIIIWALLTGTVYAQSKAGFYVVGGKVITVQDTSSRNYLKAIENAGVVPSVLQNAASNFLVTSEKAIGSYSLMVAQYPFMGGTSATHKFNLNNPVDTDGGRRLVFTGTVNHSANGMQGDGSTGYANTFINNSILTPNSIHLSFYSLTNRTSTDQREMGFEAPSGGGNYAELIIRRVSNEAISVLGTNSTLAVFTNTDSRGYYIANRASSTSNNLVKNGIVVASNTTSNAQTFLNANVLLLAYNNTSTGTISPLGHSTLQSGYISIGAGFTSTIEIQQSRIVTFFNSMQNR